jgi:hypothetical protein
LETRAKPFKNNEKQLDDLKIKIRGIPICSEPRNGLLAVYIY